MEFGLGIASAYGRTVISVSGDLDTTALRPFASALRSADDLGDPEVHIDMEGVTVIVAEALDHLRNAHASLRAAGRTLLVVRPSRVVAAALAESGDAERFA